MQSVAWHFNLELPSGCLCSLGSSVDVTYLLQHRALWVRTTRKDSWLAYLEMQPDAVGRPGVFGHSAFDILCTGMYLILFWHTRYYGSVGFRMHPWTVCVHLVDWLVWHHNIKMQFLGLKAIDPWSFVVKLLSRVFKLCSASKEE